MSTHDDIERMASRFLLLTDDQRARVLAVVDALIRTNAPDYDPDHDLSGLCARLDCSTPGSSCALPKGHATNAAELWRDANRWPRRAPDEPIGPECFGGGDEGSHYMAQTRAAELVQPMCFGCYGKGHTISGRWLFGCTACGGTGARKGGGR